MISFTVPVAAIGKARARQGKGGFYTPAPTARAERLIGAYARNAMGAQAPLGGACCITVAAQYEPPKSWSKKKRAAAINGEIPKTSKPDGSNILKLVEDALNSICFVDDAHLIRANVSKVYGPKNELCVMVWDAEKLP